jgi:hypothetical protein
MFANWGLLMAFTLFTSGDEGRSIVDDDDGEEEEPAAIVASHITV